MNMVSEKINSLIKDIVQQLSDEFRQMVKTLTETWSHIGFEENEIIDFLQRLVQVNRNLHQEVMDESEFRLKEIQGEIDKLKKEAERLSKCLSVDISILDYQDDMTLNGYKKQLENHISGYRKEMEQRCTKMSRLLEWQDDLVEKLGVTMRELQEEPLPSEDELNKFKAHLEVLQAERDKRVEIFLNTQIDVKSIMEKLDLKPQTKFQQTVMTALSVDFQVTDLNMDRLGKLHQDLQQKYDQVNNRVLEHRERLTKLWDCLDEHPIYRDNFLSSHKGCNPNTEQAIKDEIKRCEQLKKQKIQQFVGNIRIKIKHMWDNIMYCEQQRLEFVHYYKDVFTEDILTLHELYLEKITKFYNDNKNIFDLVQTRRELWMKMSELEARATEPGRYQNRGGQLLKEEKERKQIASNLPKIEEQLRALCAEYAIKTGENFTIDGKSLTQVIEEEWEKRKAERQNKLSARKQALQPGSAHAAASPLGKRNRTAAGLASHDRQRSESKRPLVTSSANRALTTNSNNVTALKRSAMSTVKRRQSGRLASKALPLKEKVKRKLEYSANMLKQVPKVAVNGNILKHKRKSIGKRRSNGRRSGNATSSTTDETVQQKNPLMESTMMTTYTDFKENINENQISRSSMAMVQPKIVVEPVQEKVVNRKTPRKGKPMTPLVGKENLQHSNILTPKSTLFTPTKLTRSTLKVNNDCFATPKAPASAAKGILQRQNSATPLSAKSPTPNNFTRSKTHLHLTPKNFPPIM